MKDFTCIVCPAGCTITYHDDGTVTGNKCPRGAKYVLAEATNPVRTVTSTVALEMGGRCPVRTNEAVPKDKMLEVMQVIRAVKAKTPLKVGDVIVANICGTGADLVATANAD